MRSRRRGQGCTFKPGTEPMMTATPRRRRGEKRRQGSKRCRRRAAANAELRGAEEPIFNQALEHALP